MPTPAEIRTAVDDKLSTIWSAIQNRQDTFFTANGRYWEGRRTHSVIPADGVESLPDVGTSANTGSTAWPAAIRNATLPMAIQVTAYDGPDGKGYEATVIVQIAGHRFQRTAQVGPETYRAVGWHQVDASGLN